MASNDPITARIYDRQNGFRVKLHGSKPEPLMSALGQKRTSEHVRGMSALPPKADIGSARPGVGSVPQMDLSNIRDVRSYSLTEQSLV
jgi:hypothetical protein